MSDQDLGICGMGRMEGFSEWAGWGRMERQNLVGGSLGLFDEFEKDVGEGGLIGFNAD